MFLSDEYLLSFTTIDRFITFPKKKLFIFTDMDKTRRRMTDIPQEELVEMMTEYGKKHSTSVRSARKYLRSLGMTINNRGVLLR